MSDRDRQNPYERSHQQGGDNAWGDYDTPRQANQWQTDGDRQQGGGGTRGGGQRGGSDDYSRDYRFSGQGDFDDRGASGAQSYRSQLNDDGLHNDQRDASRNYERARGGYGQHRDDWRGQHRDREQLRGSDNNGLRNYGGRDFDASGGNDFGNFTSEDYGGRDFYNRGGAAAGGARSSESYRPSYGVGSWLRGDDDDNRQSSRGSSHSQNRGREDYGSWRQYGESRGFLERAGDEIASWFGNEDASRRRDRDHREDAGSNAYGSQSHRGRGPSNYTRSDERIREDANDHLTHDWGVDATHVTVSVKDGELTLDGTVDSRQAKRRAEDAVEHVSGVKHVQNNLRVQERSSNFGSSNGSGSASGQNSSYGAGSGLTGSSSTTAGSQAGSGQAASASTSSAGSGTTGASTTGGIGSTAGAGGATASRLGEKTS